MMDLMPKAGYRSQEVAKGASASSASMARTSTEFFLNFNQLIANKESRTLPKDYCLTSHVKREGKVWALLAFLVPGSQLSECLFGGKQDWGTARMPSTTIADPQLEGGRKGKRVSLCLLRPIWRGPQQWKGVHACPTGGCG